MASVGVLWMGGEFFYGLYDYFRLSASAPAILDQWDVTEEKKGEFSIRVAYRFEWKKEAIRGVYTFKKPVYHNPYVANDQTKEWQAKSWVIWFDPSQPTFNSLQRDFPLRQGIKLFFCLAILLYFVFLKGYVRRIDGLDRSD